MNELNDTAARAALAVLDLDDSVYRVTVEIEDDGRRSVISAWRCDKPGHQTHVQIDSSQPWNKDAADAETFERDRP